MLDNPRHSVERVVYHALRLLSQIVEHLFYRILDVGNLSCYGLGLRLHKSSELAALVRHRPYRSLELLRTDLSCRDEFTHFVLGDAELRGKFFGKRNTPTHKLPQVLCEHTPLCHRCAIEVHEVCQRQGQTCSNVAQACEGLVHLIGGCAVSEQLFRSVGDIGHIERSNGGGVDELRHQLVRLLLAAEHRAKSDFQLLELSSDLGNLCGEIFQFVNSENADHCRTDFPHRSVNVVTLCFGCLAYTLQQPFALRSVRTQLAVVK